MEELGAEVSQKMRSAVKAKLMELGCYVDNELPDYIMVMVANKRSKSQMSADLQLFLASKTDVFVEWLSIVLKKLKEVTVTNPEIYKKVSKQRIGKIAKSEMKLLNAKIKKEKKDKSKLAKRAKIKDHIQLDYKQSATASLTDDLPINANSLSEKRKIVVAQENERSRQLEISEDNFDIAPLSAAADDSDTEVMIPGCAAGGKNVKSRLGSQIASDNDEAEDEDFLNIKLGSEDGAPSNDRNTKIDRVKHPRIMFDVEEESRKKSVLDRLGKRTCGDENSEEIRCMKRLKPAICDDAKQVERVVVNSDHKQSSPLPLAETINELRRKVSPGRRQSALKRLGVVMSKVAIPERNKQPEEDDSKEKEVASCIKVKPRPLPPTGTQANKNLLLKAVAEAQRSIAQTPMVGSGSKPDALFTRNFKLKMQKSNSNRKHLDEADKSKLKKLLLEEVRAGSTTEYIPRSIAINEMDDAEERRPDSDSKRPTTTARDQQFIITLDGVEAIKSAAAAAATFPTNPKHTHIVFDLDTTRAVREQQPQRVRAAPAAAVVTVKKTNNCKEKCKFWPACKQGSNCDFLHPSLPCKSFPQCKFGDRCLYIHPACKFETSCTRKDCPYNHTPKSAINNSALLPTQICKYSPNCSNTMCTFYHPKACKFGKYCKNQSCTYFHGAFAGGKNANLTWRPSV